MLGVNYSFRSLLDLLLPVDLTKAERTRTSLRVKVSGVDLLRKTVVGWRQPFGISGGIGLPVLISI